MKKLDAKKAGKTKRKTASKKNKKIYLLKLYITGNTPQSMRAILNLKRICEEHLQDLYDLEIIDIYKRPHLAREQQIIAAPTLVKSFPQPLRRLIGDLSNEEKVLMGLDLPTRAQIKLSADGQ